MIPYDSLMARDITVHTKNHKYRGILVYLTPGTLTLEVGIDTVYIDRGFVVAVTSHGREYGKEE